MSELVLLFIGIGFGLIGGALAMVWLLGYATNKANKGFETWFNKRER